MSFDSDNFTGTPSDQINGRTSSGGNTWVADTMMIVTSGTKAGLSNTGSGWAHSGAVPSDDDYIVEADFTIVTLLSINTTNHFLFSHGTPTTRAERIVGGIMLDGSDIKAMCRRRTAGFGDFDIGSRVTATFTTGSYHLSLRVADAGSNIWNVTLTITRASDGFYLPSGGTWQSGAANVVNTTWDDNTLVGAGAPLPSIGRAGFEAFDLIFNVDYDNFVARYPGGIALNPSSVVKGSINNAIVITGDGNTPWTPGTPGTPTFTADNGTIQSQSVSGTALAAIVYDAPASAGTDVITDPLTPFTADLTVTEPETLLGGLIGAGTRVGSVSFDCPTASGGTPPFTYEWQTSNLAEGTFASIGGQTAQNLTSYSPSGTEWIRRKVTDHASVVAYSNVVPIAIDASTTPSPSIAFKTDPTPIVLGFIGDSITDFGDVVACATRMATLASPRDITVGFNAGLSGSSTTSWAHGQTLLSDAIADFLSNNITDVCLMLGANDPLTSVATYLANLTGTVADLVTAGFRVHLQAPTWAHDAWKTLAGTQLLYDYRAALASLHNGTTIFYADQENFFDFAANAATYLADNVHPNATGSTHMAQRWGDAMLRDLEPNGFTASPSTIPKLIETPLIYGGLVAA